MKYLLLIYNDPAVLAAMTEAERQAVFTDVDTILKELAASGEYVRGEALGEASQSRTVRLRPGLPAVTDGPYIEAKEQVAGYVVVETETIERAVEIAKRWPDARYGAMEVRPIVHTGMPDA